MTGLLPHEHNAAIIWITIAVVVVTGISIRPGGRVLTGGVVLLVLAEIVGGIYFSVGGSL